MPETIAIIPARAGSQRIPGKNIRPLAGHPLLAYSIAAAQQSGVCDRVIVSTDSAEIAEIATAYGAEVPGMRPAEISGSDAHDVLFLRMPWSTGFQEYPINYGFSPDPLAHCGLALRYEMPIRF